ncbi:MAG: hypothetical protein A2Y41_00300 [Spirochaetes bacterium GWB1_36_13]|nr:MAG: hypothetical protein A2Y41_00300 [Spirochaetes bacterium GWB1_36_13]
MTEILSLSEKDPERKKMFDLSIRSADLLLEIINNILDLSKIEQEFFELNLEEFLISEICLDISNIFNNYSSSSIHYSCNIENDFDFPMKEDKLRIKQILINLLWECF